MREPSVQLDFHQSLFIAPFTLPEKCLQTDCRSNPFEALSCSFEVGRGCLIQGASTVPLCGRASFKGGRIQNFPFETLDKSVFPSKRQRLLFVCQPIPKTGFGKRSIQFGIQRASIPWTFLACPQLFGLYPFRVGSKGNQEETTLLGPGCVCVCVYHVLKPVPTTGPSCQPLRWTARGTSCTRATCGS